MTTLTISGLNCIKSIDWIVLEFLTLQFLLLSDRVAFGISTKYLAGFVVENVTISSFVLTAFVSVGTGAREFVFDIL
jgi:hypothetical protein